MSAPQLSSTANAAAATFSSPTAAGYPSFPIILRTRDRAPSPRGRPFVQICRWPPRHRGTENRGTIFLNSHCRKLIPQWPFPLSQLQFSVSPCLGGQRVDWSKQRHSGRGGRSRGISHNKPKAHPRVGGGALDYLHVVNQLSGTRSTNQMAAGTRNAAVCGAVVPATERGK